MRKIYRKGVIFIMVIWLMINNLNFVLANSMQDSYNQAESYRQYLKLGNPDQLGNKVIFDKDADISNLTNMKDHELTNQGGNILNNSAEGKFLQQMEVKKIDALQEYDLNNQNPLIVNANEIAADPLKHTEGSGFSINELVTTTKITKTCTEGVNFTIDIVRQLILETELTEKWGEWQDKIMKIDIDDLPNSYVSHERLSLAYSGRYDWDSSDDVYYKTIKEKESLVQNYLKQMIAEKLNSSVNNIADYIRPEYTYYRADVSSFFNVKPSNIVNLNFQYRDRIKEFIEKGEYWQVVNEETEKLAEENECHELNRICLDRGNRVFFNNYHVNRPCWKEQISYHCTSQPQEGCKHLKAQGYQLENSNCLKRHSNICLLWQRNYNCFTEKKSLSSSLKNASMFCLGGDCHTQTIEQNTDIANVGYLAMLSEMKQDMHGTPIQVFKGEANKCNKFMVSFLNCCSSMKGWGKDLGLGKCKAEEKALALKKAKGLCHEVGTYCAEKDPIFKKCLRKKIVYCCFNSKLARVFQKQGRAQLGISFGTTENANCRGFTVEELQRIDFSKFNMEELFADLLLEAKSKMGKSFPKQLHNQMPVMQLQIPINSKSYNSNLSY